MSASPSGQSNGPTPNGGPPRYISRPKAADPLRPRKKPVRKPNGTLKPAARTNGPPTTTKFHGQYPVNGIGPPRGTMPHQMPIHAPIPASNDGWTHYVAPQDKVDYALVTTKRAMREGLRYHMARFTSKKDVDPRDQDEFTRPVLLHRRDPKQGPRVKAEKDEPMEDVPMDSKEREKQEILRAEKEKQRAADLAQIAPTGNNASAMAAKKTQAFRNEKTTQVHRLDKTEEQKKASDLRYEEALPWHLEDADDKNTWVGSYEAALSDTNVILVIKDNCFQMIPVEKWYKFTPKPQFKTFTLEEAEAIAGKKVKESRWVMRANEQNQERQAAEKGRKAMHGLFMVKAESNTFKNAGKREVADMDDLDFQEDDLFQDDDEQVTVEPDKDEEVKEAQDRIKREQRSANIFDQANEADVDEELDEEEKEVEERKLLGKGVKKALKKRERNFVYDSDSDHPYSDASDDETSDDEKQKEIDRKKEEEAKNKVKTEGKTPGSGTSSKGTTTPLGRPKSTDPLKKVKSLKRPGSPNLSESSGNESSRKKLKKHTSSQPTGTSTPQPGSRQASPAPSTQPVPGQSPRKPSTKLNTNSGKMAGGQGASGATSDGEATGGENSAKPRIKLRMGGSPTGSRAGSPAPGRSGSVGAGGSRAGSPAPRATSPASNPVQPAEVAAALPAEGISLGDLVKVFKTRLVAEGQPGTNKKDFITMVKQNSVYGSDKLLRPKPAV